MPTTAKRFNVEVTAKDIARAKQNDSYGCVVVQAIARTIPDAHRIEVDTQAIRFTRATTGERLVYLTPYAVQGYVIAFDAGDKIEPFRFALNERQMVKVRRRLQTPAGKHAQRAKNRERRRTAPAGARTKADRHLDGVPVTDARGAYAEARKEMPGVAAVSTAGERKAPPRVIKDRRRSYGHRLLRINRPKVAEDAANA